MKPKHKFITLSLSIMLLSTGLYAQIDKNKNNYKKEFESFKNKIQQEFNDFQNKNDSIFLHFLKDSWQSFNLIYNQKTEIPKPSKQPLINEVEKIDLKISPIKQKGNIRIKTGEKLILNNEIIIKLEKFKINAEISSSINFYGNKLDLYYNKDIPVIKYIKSENINNYFRKASSNNDFIKTALLLKITADKCNLNDWGFLKILQYASAKMYSDVNNRVLFTWFALLQNGYNVKIAYNNTKVFLLIPSNQEIFNTSYFSIQNQKFYIVKFNSLNKNPESLIAHKADYPNNSNSFSLILNKVPIFSNAIFEKDLLFDNKTFKIPLNLNLIRFYHDYPDCELKVYFNAKISDNTLKSLDSYFYEIMKDKSQLGNINFLLDFIQHAIPYISDKDQFGKENYLFAEETLYYSGADCEDRAALLAQLIDHYINIKTIGLSFPEHISLAANLSKPIKGVYLPFSGDNY